jgi:hypothetical protein
MNIFANDLGQGRLLRPFAEELTSYDLVPETALDILRQPLVRCLSADAMTAAILIVEIHIPVFPVRAEIDAHGTRYAQRGKLGQ